MATSQAAAGTVCTARDGYVADSKIQPRTCFFPGSWFWPKEFALLANSEASVVRPLSRLVLTPCARSSALLKLPATRETHL